MTFYFNHLDLTGCPRLGIGPRFRGVLAAGLLLCATRLAGADSSSTRLPVLKDAPVVQLPHEATIGMKSQEMRLYVVVEVDGSVSNVTLVDSQGEVIDAALTTAARSLRFEPARVDGKPTRARFGISLRVGPRETPGAALILPSAPSLPPIIRREQEQVEEVVITGTRVPERKAQSVIATQTLTREALRKTGARNVAEALEAQPGLQISRSFRGAELWIRGLDPEYTLVLVDGQRVPGRTGGAIDLSRFPLESIERVEIVRGPSSALYGSDAIGGVVNIITRQTARPVEADAEARIATESAAAGSGRAALHRPSGFGASVSGGHQHTAAFRRDSASIGTDGSARTLNSAGASVSYGKGRHLARLTSDYTRTRLEGVDEGAGGAIFDRTQVQEQSLFSGQYRYQSGALFLQNAVQYSHFRDQYLLDQRGALALDSYEQGLEHLTQVSTTLANDWSPNHRTTVGIETLSQVLESPRLSGKGLRVRYSLFSEHRWVLLRSLERELLTVVPGIRADVDSQFGDQVSPKLALRADPSKRITLRAGYGRGFRAPSFQELLLRFENPAVGYIVEGNPDLHAESSHSGDVSADWRPGGTWFFSGAAFYNLLSGMIGTVTRAEGTSQGTVFSYENINEAWTRGLEALSIWSPTELFSLTVGYTFLETKDSERNRPLIGRPRHRFTTRIGSEYEPWGVSVNARGSLSLERSYFEDPDGDGSEDHVYGAPLLEADIRVAKAFNPHFEVFAGVNNAADAGDRYVTLLPRQGYAGVGGSY